MKDTPIFINAKDRKSCLQQLLERLMRDGLDNIFIVDTGSTYPPMMDYLATIKFPIIQCVPSDNYPPKFALWDCGVIAKSKQSHRPYVYTDCDVIPDEECPNDWIEYLFGLLKKYPDYAKVGMGLKLADIPDHYAHKNAVMENEMAYWKTSLEPHVYSSCLDTTLCLYRADAEHTYRAVRTGGKYIVRHLPWYYDSSKLPEEEMHYIKNLHPKASFWTRRDKS